MAYETENRVGSPRLHLQNILRENKIYSEFPKEWFVKIIEEAWYYFSQELLEKQFDLANSICWKTSGEFMKITWYSRPKINAYIEKHGRIVYLAPGYYNLEEFTEFLKTHIKEHIEKRGRPAKSEIFDEVTPEVQETVETTETVDPYIAQDSDAVETEETIDNVE